MIRHFLKFFPHFEAVQCFLLNKQVMDFGGEYHRSDPSHYINQKAHTIHTTDDINLAHMLKVVVSSIIFLFPCSVRNKSLSSATLKVRGLALHLLEAGAGMVYQKICGHMLKVLVNLGGSILKPCKYPLSPEYFPY